MITLRQAQVLDSVLLWRWINGEQSRTMAWCHKLIDKTEHIGWLIDKLESSDDRLFIILLDQQPVGSCRLSLQDTHAIVSITLAPEAQGLGIAAQALRELIRIARATPYRLLSLQAHIRAENAPALRAFQKAGFKEVGKVYEYDLTL